MEKSNKIRTVFALSFSLALLLGGAVCLIGIRMSVISIALLWLVFVINRIFAKRKLIAASVSLLATVPALVLINVSLVPLIGGEVFGFWDILSSAVIALTSITLFLTDRKKIT